MSSQVALSLAGPGAPSLSPSTGLLARLAQASPQARRRIGYAIAAALLAGAGASVLSAINARKREAARKRKEREHHQGESSIWDLLQGKIPRPHCLRGRGP